MIKELMRKHKLTLMRLNSHWKKKPQALNPLKYEVNLPVIGEVPNADIYIKAYFRQYLTIHRIVACRNF